MVWLGTAAVVAAVISAGGSAGPKQGLELGVKSAIPNQVVVMVGPGTRGRRVKVTVGGKQARVLRGRGKFLVPAVGPGRKRVVVKTAKGKLRGRLRIKKVGRFTGSITVTLEPERAAQAMIGPAGGTISVTGGSGARYTLTVPEGALPTATAITATPAAAVRGLPVKRINAVQFGPEGLTFATPARLEIVPASGSPERMAGFSADGAGTNVGFQPGQPSGDAIVLDVEHFSTYGSFQRSLDDFLIFLGDLVQRAIANRAMTQSEVEFFIEGLRAFRLTLENCRDNPTCAFLAETARRAMIQLGEAECVNPETAVGSELVRCIWDGVRLEADFQLLGLDDAEAQRVIRRVHADRVTAGNRLVREVKGAAESDPMGNYANEVFLTPRDRGVGRITDREPDSHVSNAEIALGLAGNLALLGNEVQTNELTGAVETGLEQDRSAAAALCETDRNTALSQLRRILKYAEGPIALQTDTSIQACVPRIRITPTEATLTAGSNRTFTATANDGETSFTWSASAGTITQAGVFTAPQTPGDVTVTVALPAHPDVTASATVHVAATGYSVDSTDDTLSMSSLVFAGCAGDPNVVNGGRVHTSGLSTSSSAFNQPFALTANRSCLTGTANAQGAGQMTSSFDLSSSSPLRIAAGLSVFGAASTNADNAGGTNGVWLLVRGDMEFDFSVGVASTAHCTATFRPDVMKTNGDPHVTISSQANPTALDIGPVGQVEATAPLPAGDYHLSASASYQGDDTTPVATSNAGAGFTFSCEVTPAA